MIYNVISIDVII